MDRSSLKALGRAGLQRLAKAKGVRAVGPSSKIIDSLLECVKGKSTVSDETSVLEEAGSNVFKDVKNSVVVNGERSDAADASGTRKSGRLAATVDKMETANKKERPEKHVIKSARGSRENTVVVPVTRSLSLDELNAIQAMLLFQDILPPPKTDSEKPPATVNTKRKRDRADPEEQAPAKASTSRESQKRRKTGRS
ncbi:hypothetical protein V8D89_003327 [Ganoderma adspersum]